MLGSPVLLSGRAGMWNVHRQTWTGAWNPPLKNDETLASYLPLWASEPSDLNQCWVMLFKAVAPMGAPLVLPFWWNHGKTWIWSMGTEVIHPDSLVSYNIILRCLVNLFLRCLVSLFWLICLSDIKQWDRFASFKKFGI